MIAAFAKNSIRRLSFLALCAYPLSAYANVDHKQDQLEQYLDQIGGSMDEKTMLIDTINENSGGNFLELGCGRETVGFILPRVNPGNKTKMIFSDIDEEVLNSVNIKFGDLILNKSTPEFSIELRQMNALNLSHIEDSELDGIGASALVHEIYSYEAGITSVNKFFLEAMRALKPGGVLIYRDPLLLDPADEPQILEMRSEISRKFFALFISKFFGSQVVKSAHQNPKRELSSTSFVTFTDKNNVNTRIPLDVFLSLPLGSIDFNKEFFLESKAILIAEVERHFNLFSKNILAGAKEPLESFLDEFDHGFIFPSIKGQLLNLFPEAWKKFSQTGQINEVSNETVVVDPRLVAVLFDDLLSQHLGPSFKTEAFAWLKREGRESYFYLDLDQLLANMVSLTHSNIGNPSHPYLLAPDSSADIRILSRDQYVSELSQHFHKRSVLGDEKAPSVSKVVIKFRLVTKSTAIETYRRIASEQPDYYRKLTTALASLKL